MTDSRIIFHIVIQAQKIDVDFRGDSFLYKQEDVWKALLMFLITFCNRVSVSFFEDDCWQFF